MDRRTFLAAGTAAVGAMAGCGGVSGGGDGAGGSDDSTRTATAAEGGDYSHSSLAALDEQPFLGPPPREARGLIVAFEDPSCTRCRAFEERVVPEIRANLVDPGAASLVFRGYPVVYQWGQPAVRALEATFDRDAGTFWSLVDHYFGNQSEFRSADAASVYEKTATFLSDQTDLDGDAVVAAAADGEYDAAVQTDLDAGKAAGAGRTTPHIFLFRDGQFLTKAAGSVSYGVIESALSL